MSRIAPSGADSLRVAITHDFAEVYGGAERVTQALLAEFPDAELWTILGRPEVVDRMGATGRWHSLLRGRPWLYRRYRVLAPLYPALLRARRLPEVDVVLSSSYAFAHMLRSVNDAPQVCYCHSPLRFAWSMTESYETIWSSSSVGDVAFRALAAGMRWTDRRAARRVDAYLTQSPYTADQIARFYGQQAEVIGAPIDCDLFKPAAPERAREDFFLICGRLIEPYKRVGIAVEAFRRLGLPLVVAGGGPALAELRAAAPPNVTFTGELGDSALVDLMQRARALVFPSQDDFGLAPVEAMACGTPIIAFRGGGATHTVVDGVTGVFFDEQTPSAIEAAVRAFPPPGLEPSSIRIHAQRWDVDGFRARVRAAVERAGGVAPSAGSPAFASTSAPTTSGGDVAPLLHMPTDDAVRRRPGSAPGSSAA